ncbi:MAG: AI-2E family transporter, partial [Alphaproteobacteria bacterium]|nr:AI-2E family transporter [Alphaproteobacteria bacterium]
MTKQEVNNQRYILILTVMLVLGALLYVLRSVLLPFVVGIAVAYFLDPLVNRIAKSQKISRNVATVAVMTMFLLILLPILVLLGSMAFSQLSDFWSSLPQYLESFVAKVKLWVRYIRIYFPALGAENFEELWQGNISESVKPVMKIMQSFVANGFAFINLLSLLLISPVVAFYMLRDWHGFTGKIYDLVPHKHKQTVLDGVAAVDRIISGYLRGQMMVCVALGSFYSLGLWLIGLKLGLLVGFLAGLIS